MNALMPFRNCTVLGLFAVIARATKHFLSTMAIWRKSTTPRFLADEK